MRTWLKAHAYDIFSVLLIVSVGWIYCMYAPTVQGINGDAGCGHYALWAACARSWHSGEVPLWNPYQWGGFSTVGHIQEVFYPVLIALEFIFWDSTTQMLSFSIYPAYIAVHFIIGGCGLYVLGRSRNKTPQTACAVSLLVVASGCFMFGDSWGYIWGSYCWIPWLIWALYRMVETERAKWITISGFILAMLVLSSTAHGALFAVLIYALLFGTAVWEKRADRKECVQLIFWFLASGFIGMGIAAIELFPFLETNLNAFRYVPGLTMMESQGKIPLAAFKEHAVNISEIGAQFGGYIGMLAISTLALALIVIGFFSKHRQHDWLRNFSVILMFGALLYTIGFNIVDIFWYIPGFNAIREPFLYAPFVVISGSILMFEGIGIIEGVLCGGKNSSWKESLENMSVCNGLLLVLMLITMLPHMIFNTADLIIKMIILLAGVAIFCRLKIKKMAFYGILFVMVILSTFNWVKANSLPSNVDASSACIKAQEVSLRTKELLDELDVSVQGDGDPTARYLCWYPGGVLPSNVASIIGERDCFAYVNPIYKKTYFAYQYLDLRQKCQLQNIKYILLGNEDEEFRNWLESEVGEKSEMAQTRAFAGFDSTEDQIVRYIDTTDLNLGPAWVVNKVIPYQESPEVSDVENAEAVFWMMNDDSVDFSKSVFVEQNVVDRLDIQETDDMYASVECTVSSANKTTYQVQTDADGIFVTSDYDYPGWRVKIDGREEDIIEVNYCFRGVQIPQGEHVIEFTYRPTSLIIGIGTAVVAIIISIVCMYSDKAKKVL